MKYLLKAVAALVMTSGAAEAASPSQTIDAILAENHAAVGDMPTVGSAILSYAYSSSGLTGERRDEIDLATGAYLVDEQAGGIADARGFDGRTPWQRDISGANTAQEGGDRVACAVNEAYRFASLWWRSDRGGADIILIGREVLDGLTLDHLRITPRGGKPFDAWFDANSHLLNRIAEDRQFFHTRTLYADFRRDHGLMLPHAVTIDNGAGEASYDRLAKMHYVLAATRPLTAYSRPTAAPIGASIDRGQESTTVPFRLLNNHIYLEVKVDGKGPYTFILDTGGHTIITPHLAKELGLQPVGSAASSGAGEGTSTTGYVHFDDIAIGAAHLGNQMAFATEIYDKSAIEGITVDGMVGFELFRRMAVEIDYGRRTVTFTDPARFTARDVGTAIPFVFYDHMPMVRGFIDDLPARFDIDTGSRTEVDVTGPFVASKNLRARYPKGISAVTGWGMGGPSRAYTVRIPSITLGELKVENPTAGLSEDKGGSLNDPNYEGNVGSAFLKRFVVTFDYEHQKMYLKRIQPAPADAGQFDRSGMWINASADGYVVTYVAAGGPAAQAGIAVGDLIVSVAGVHAIPGRLSDARMALRATAASSVRLLVRRGPLTRTATLTLQDQI